MTNMTNMTSVDAVAFAVEVEQDRELDAYLASSENQTAEEIDAVAFAVEVEQDRELDAYLASSEPTADDLDYLREQYKLSALLADVRAIMSPILAQYDNDAPF